MTKPAGHIPNYLGNIMIGGALTLGMGQWPLGMGQWPLGMGQWPFGMGQWPLGKGQCPLLHNIYSRICTI